jgi:predicted aconitase
MASLEWISDLRGTVAVPSILNPAGMDLCRWQEMGISEDFAAKQEQTIEAYRKLGVSIDCTCTPYQIYDSLARLGEIHFSLDLDTVPWAASHLTRMDSNPSPYFWLYF